MDQLPALARLPMRPAYFSDEVVWALQPEVLRATLPGSFLRRNQTRHVVCTEFVRPDT